MHSYFFMGVFTKVVNAASSLQKLSLIGVTGWDGTEGNLFTHKETK